MQWCNPASWDGPQWKLIILSCCLPDVMLTHAELAAVNRCHHSFLFPTGDNLCSYVILLIDNNTSKQHHCSEHLSWWHRHRCCQQGAIWVRVYSVYCMQFYYVIVSVVHWHMGQRDVKDDDALKDFPRCHAWKDGCITLQYLSTFMQLNCLYGENLKWLVCSFYLSLYVIWLYDL